MHLKWEFDNTKDYCGWCPTAASSLVGTTGNLWMFQVLGSIPWQTYFQRVLSTASTGQARLISYLSGLGCFAMAIPSVLIGAVAASTGKRIVCLWVINMFLAKVIKRSPDRDFKLPSPMALDTKIGDMYEKCGALWGTVHNYLKTIKQTQDLFKAISLWWNDFSRTLHWGKMKADSLKPCILEEILCFLLLMP